MQPTLTPAEPGGNEEAWGHLPFLGIITGTCHDRQEPERVTAAAALALGQSLRIAARTHLPAPAPPAMDAQPRRPASSSRNHGLSRRAAYLWRGWSNLSSGTGQRVSL